MFSPHHMKKKTVLTIGGSDPSGGAGIQTDIKAITSLNLHAAAIPSCITVQNTQKVSRFQPVSKTLLQQQIDTLMEDVPITYVKIGMLANKELIEVIRKKTKQYRWKIIVDPVMKSTSNDALSTKTYLDSLVKKLFPTSFMITPNLTEASAILDNTISSIEEMYDAAEKIQRLGSQSVFIKGGHRESEFASDVFFNGEKHFRFDLPYIKHRKAHGSGCTLSSLITAYLASRLKPAHAVQQAKHVIWNMIRNGYKIGGGMDVLDVTPSVVSHAPPSLSPDQFTVWYQLSEVVNRLPNMLYKDMIPEVGINIGYALSGATTPKDICAISGRIIKMNDAIVPCGCLQFGSSHHVASIILSAMQLHPKMRCAMNIKYSEQNLALFQNQNFIISSFDRKNEPSDASSTMEWGTTQALKKLKRIPNIIYDKGGWGKEPMIRILGENPKEVVKTLSQVTKNIHSSTGV